MAITWEEYLAETTGGSNTTANNTMEEQVWDDADSSQNFRLRGGDAPEVFHDITPTGDTKNERSKVYKQIAALNNISEEEAIKQVDAEAEAAKVDPNLGLKLKTLRQTGAYTGPITSHEIYQLGKEATMATEETEADKFDDRKNILQARTTYDDTQAVPEDIAAIDPNSLEKGFFGRGLMDTDTTDDMISKGYFAPGTVPDSAINIKKYNLETKAMEKAKRLGLGGWEDPTQAKIMQAIRDTSYVEAQAKERGVDGDRAYLEQLTNLPQAALSGLGKAAFDLADTTVELIGDVAGRVVSPISKDYGRYLDDVFDLAKDEEKTNAVNSLVGYDNEFTKANMQKVSDLYDTAMDKVTWYKPSTWVDMDVESLGKAAQTAFADIETSGYSIGYIAPALLGLGGKTAKKAVGGVVESHLDDAASNLKLVASGKLTEEAAKKAAKESLESMSKLDRTKLFLVNNADALAYGAMMNNNQMDEYIKNNGGEDATVLRSVVGTAFNALGMKLDMGVLNSIIKPGKDGVNTAIDKLLVDMGESRAKALIGKTLELTARAGLAGVKEMPQEWTQSLIEEFNSVYGTKKEDGSRVGAIEAFDKSRQAAGVGAIAGLAGGAHMSLGASAVTKGPGMLLDAAGLTLQTVGKAAEVTAKPIKKMVDTRAENQRIARNEKDRAERVSYLESKGTDFDKFTPETAVEDVDAESSIIIEDTPESEAILKKITEAENRGAPIEEIEALGDEWIKAQKIVESKLYVSPANLKVEAKDVNDYDRLLGEQRDKVVQSVYEIDPKTKKIKGLTAEAKELMESDPDALQAKVDKVDKWLVSYENEYAKPAQLRDADQSVVDSITDDDVINDKLTDAQRTELSISIVNKHMAGTELSTKEANYFSDSKNKVNEEIAKAQAEGQIEIPQAIKKQVDYFTGYDAKVHLEPLEARRLEMQEAAENEIKAEELKAQIVEKEATITEDNKDEVQAEINKMKVEVDELNAKAKMQKINEKATKAEDVDKTIEDNMVQAAEKAVGLDKLEETEIAKIYTHAIMTRNSKVENGKIVYNEGWNEERVKAIAEPAAARTKAINRKYNFDPEVEADANYDMLISETGKAKEAKGKVVDSSTINGNEFAKAIIDGDAKDAVITYDKNSTKLVHRIFNKLGITNTKSKYPVANKVMSKIKEVVESEAGKAKLKKIFTDAGIAEGEGVILLVNAMGAINAATVTDTMARQKVESGAKTANLAKDEYWASEANVTTQIGKDFMTARGIKLSKGTPTQQAEQYRKIGAVALELAIDAGLVARSNDNISSVVSDRLVTAENKKVGGGTTGVTRVSLDTQARDLMNSEKKMTLNLSDHGVRIVDDKYTGKTVEEDTGYVLEYKSEVADVIGRINKLLISGNLEVPKNSPSNYVKVSNTVTPYKDGSVDIVDTVVKLQNTPYKIKPNMLKLLEQIKKEVDDKYEGDLDKYLANKGKWVASMLGIDKYATGSRILAFNDAGVSNGIKDSLRGIIDNLEDLKGDMYFTYQIDKNNRITIRETVMNFQADKVIARQILMPANSGKSFKMGNKEDILETQMDMLNELGFQADLGSEDASADYAKAIDIILNKEFKDKPANPTNSELIAWEIVDLLTGKYTEQEIAEALNDKNSPLKTKGKKTIKGMELIDGFRVMRETGGKETNYMSETDAKASGVMNVLMNIIGFDVAPEEGKQTVQQLLEQLGVKLSDSDAANMLKSPKDAYNLLQDKVKEILGDDSSEGRRRGSKYAEVKQWIDELGEMKIDTRELAKPPVMTWFYTAGTETIVNELATTLLEQVFRKAIDGDNKAIAHLNKLIGKDASSKLEMMNWQIGGKEHKTILNSYRKIGELYESQLEAAFPGVSKFKDKMQEMFDAIEVTGYANGIIDSAGQAVYGGEGQGKFNIYQEKQYVQELTDEKIKGKAQLTEDAANRQLVTGNDLFSNFTSLIPLMAQGVDFTILEKTMRELYAKYEDNPDFAPMTVHDAIYVSLKYMRETGKASYNRTIVDVANRYDFVDTIINYAEDTAKAMKKARTAMNEVQRVEQDKQIKVLEDKIAVWKAENGARLDHKKSKLRKVSGDSIETDLMGGTDIKQESDTKIPVEVEKVNTPKSQGPRDVLINKAKGMATPFAEATEKEVIDAIKGYQKSEFGKVNSATLEEYAMVLGSENTVDSVVEALAKGDRLTELGDAKAGANRIMQRNAITEFRKTAEKNPVKAVNDLISTLVGLGDSNAKTMQDIMKSRTIEWAWGDEFSIGQSDTKDAKITIGKDAKELFGTQAILDRIGHELEHANSATLIEELAKGKGTEADKAAYIVITKVLNKLDGKQLEASGRLARIMKEADETTRVIELVAVVRGETIGSEQLVQEMRDKGLLENIVDKVIESAKHIIAMVRGKKTLEIDDNVNIEQLLQAVEQIHSSGLEVTSKVNKTMNYEAEAKQQDAKINKKEMAQELRDRLTNLANGRKLPAFEAILNKIKDC